MDQASLVNRHHEQLRRAELVGERNALLLRDESLETILERLADLFGGIRIFGNPLVLD